MKKCSTCGMEKEESEFQIRKASKDGFTASCKSCLRIRDANRYPKEREKRLLQSKMYASTPHGKQVHKKAVDAWKEKNAVRRAAQVIFGNAIKNGKIMKQPCFSCGKKAEAHHPDYSRPLDVVWLCPKHHKEVHSMKF